MTPSAVDLKQVLSPEDFERLKAEAARKHAKLSDVVRLAVEAYLDEMDESPEDSLENTPKRKNSLGLTRAWLEAQSGLAVPADEALAALRKKLDDERG